MGWVSDPIPRRAAPLSRLELPPPPPPAAFEALALDVDDEDWVDLDGLGCG